MQAFETERLIMRPLSSNDEDFYIYQYTDEQMMSLVGAPLTYEQARAAFLRALKANNSHKMTVLTWSIFDRFTTEIIGTQALSWLKTKLAVKATDKPINQAEIGMMLATHIQGKGYGKEALSALMEYGFKYLSIDRINTFHANNHSGSDGLVKSIGFTFDEECQTANSGSRYLYFDNNKWDKKYLVKVEQITEPQLSCT
ncbi:GNAT family N-acetyltransferase [Litorilituus sediminis]|uniref:N-acetyltransferase n=1 Tax=Litorilituus sediminis TaxID=718192 RepID=A0A4V0ZG26_9GAMM|nr:GNAT family N-acetyltransferase [Litorilituus sediminis]QBG35830.1 N-acetyltransferase [Litorilituus sediminis]